MRDGAGSAGQSPIEGERKYGVATDRRGPAGIWLRAQDGSEAFAPVHSTAQPIVPGDCLSWIPTYRSGTVGAEAASIRSETLGTLGFLHQPKVATAEPQIPAFVFNDEPLDQVLEAFREFKGLDDLAQLLDELAAEGLSENIVTAIHRAITIATQRNATRVVRAVKAVERQDQLVAQQQKGAQL